MRAMCGYSLLEVLFATSIVIVGVASLAHLTMVGVYANLHARQTTIAAILAQQKIEALVVAGPLPPLSRPSPPGTLCRHDPGLLRLRRPPPAAC